MRWILGLDLEPRSRGAVQLARWIARATRGGDEFVAVHVLGEDHVRAILKHQHLDEIVDMVTAADLLSEGVGDGPVAALTALREDSIAPCRFVPPDTTAPGATASDVEGTSACSSGRGGKSQIVRTAHDDDARHPANGRSGEMMKGSPG
jgi:hypothetical protein